MGWQRAGQLAVLRQYGIGVYLLSNTELFEVKILLVIRESAMVVSLNDKVTKLRKN